MIARLYGWLDRNKRIVDFAGFAVMALISASYAGFLDIPGWLQVPLWLTLAVSVLRWTLWPHIAPKVRERAGIAEPDLTPRQIRRRESRSKRN